MIRLWNIEKSLNLYIFRNRDVRRGSLYWVWDRDYEVSFFGVVSFLVDFGFSFSFIQVRSSWLDGWVFEDDYWEMKRGGLGVQVFSFSVIKDVIFESKFKVFLFVL